MAGERISPVVVTNKPIEVKEDDLFNLSVQVEELEKAIEKGAGLIGIISPQGGGKTSLVHTLAEAKKKKDRKRNKTYYKLHNVCVWPYQGKNAKNSENSMEDYMRMFLYQMSKMVNQTGFSRNISRMMSSNYRALSWSTDIDIIRLICLGLLFTAYAAVVILAGLSSADAEPDIFQKICRVASSGKDIMKIAAIAMGILICNYNSVIFSWKDSNNVRVFGEADTYEIFDTIIEQAHRREKKAKYLVNIEDLDRVTDIKDIIEFLKILYKYYNLIDEEKRNSFVFIVSLSNPACFWKKNESNANDLNQLIGLYDKFFDYLLIIRPVNEKKLKSLLENLLLKQVKRIDAELVAVMEEGWQRESADWLLKGANLSVREIKVRVNKALAICDELRAIKGRNELTEYSFLKCAVVVYLESVYPLEMYRFTSGTGIWRTIIEDFMALERENPSVQKKNQFWNMRLRNVNESYAFKEKIKEIFSCKMSGSDYWLYFFRNPKDS